MPPYDDIDLALRALTSLYVSAREDVALSIGNIFRPLLRELRERRDKADVLRPLTEEEVVAALHEGRAERMVAQGDNAWTTLMKQRDDAIKERDELRMLLKERDEY